MPQPGDGPGAGEVRGRVAAAAPAITTRAAKPSAVRAARPTNGPSTCSSARSSAALPVLTLPPCSSPASVAPGPARRPRQGCGRAPPRRRLVPRAARPPWSRATAAFAANHRVGLAQLQASLGVADLHDLGARVLHLAHRDLAGHRPVGCPVRVLHPDQHRRSRPQRVPDHVQRGERREHEGGHPVRDGRPRQLLGVRPRLVERLGHLPAGAQPQRPTCRWWWAFQPVHGSSGDVGRRGPWPVRPRPRHASGGAHAGQSRTWPSGSRPLTRSAATSSRLRLLL